MRLSDIFHKRQCAVFDRNDLLTGRLPFLVKSFRTSKDKTFQRSKIPSEEAGNYK